MDADDKHDPEFALYSTTAEAYRAGRVEGARLMQEKCAAKMDDMAGEYLLPEEANILAATIRALKPEDV